MLNWGKVYPESSSALHSPSGFVSSGPSAHPSAGGSRLAQPSGRRRRSEARARSWSAVAFQSDSLSGEERVAARAHEVEEAHAPPRAAEQVAARGALRAARPIGVFVVEGGDEVRVDHEAVAAALVAM